MTPKTLRHSLGWSARTMDRYLASLKALRGYEGRLRWLRMRDVTLLTTAARLGATPANLAALMERDAA